MEHLTLPCIQLNMHKALQSAVELGRLMDVSPGLALLQEPYTAYSRVAMVPQGLTVHSYGGDDPPRAAVLVPRRYQALTVKHLCTRDSAVVCLRIHGRTVLIASIYMDSTLSVIQPWPYDIIAFSDQKNIPLLIGADFNCHSYLFGNDSNTRGEEFELFLLTHGLDVQNRGTQPTFEIVRNGTVFSSCIDVTLTRDIEVRDWMVSQKFNGSDHHTIHFDLKISSEGGKLVRHWKETDWTTFTELLKGRWDLPDTMTPKKLDKQVQYLYSRINSALDVTSPMRPESVKTKVNVWFTEEHLSLQQKVQRLYRAHIRDKTPEAEALYRAARKKYQAKCKSDRKKSWQKHTSFTPNEHSMAKLADLVQHRERKTLGSLQKPDSSNTVDGLETLQVLANAHFHHATPIVEPRYESSRNTPSSDIKDKYSEFISPLLARRSLRKFKPYKAPGPDTLRPIIFRHFPWEVFCLSLFSL